MRLYQRSLIAAGSLLASEAIITSALIDASSMPTDHALHQYDMASTLSWGIVFGIILVLVCLLRKMIPHDLLSQAKPFSLANYALHILCFSALIWLSLHIFNGNTLDHPIALLSWVTLVICTTITWIYCLFSLSDSYTLFKKNKINVVIAATAATASLIAIDMSDTLWEPLSYITLYGSRALLDIFFSDLVIDIPEKLLGIEYFIVNIAPECSGIEGLFIAVLVTSLYCFFTRENLVFPQALLLLPIAIAGAITFNILRITLLIIIGEKISPEIAIGGFHNVSGWIMAALNSYLIVFVFSSLTLFNKEKPQSLTARTDNIKTKNNNPAQKLADALLIPFVLTLATSLIAQIFIADFNFLYPLKVFAGIAGLSYFWKIYQLTLPKQWYEPIAIGLVIAVMWITLYPQDAAYNSAFTNTLANYPLWLSAIWIASRAIGLCLIAPIIEELIFRGYILARSSKQEVSTGRPPAFSWIGLLVSSLLFGALHDAFIAGVIAGIAFAAVRYRSQSIAEPILAHMAANVFVGVWAIYSGNWVLL